MKGRQLAIVLLLLVALGGTALLLTRRNSASWRNTATASQNKILNFPLNDVSHVTIKGIGAELNLVKKDDVWRVKERADYPADFDKVSALIRKLWELRPVQDVKVGPLQLGRLDLAGPGQQTGSGTLLDLKGADDKRLGALLLGKKYLTNPDQLPLPNEGDGITAGRYVMGQDGSNRVFLVSETLDDVDPKPERWLIRDFIKIENPKSIAVIGATPTMKWSVSRETATAPWKLLDAKRREDFDAAKVSNLTTLFSAATFADVLPPDAPVAETGLDKPSTARIETFDNFVYELRIGKLMGKNYPVLISVKAELPKERTPAAAEKPEDKAKLDEDFQMRHKGLSDKLTKEQKLKNRPYLIAKSTIDQLLKDRSALMTKKKPSPSPTVETSRAGAKEPSPPKSRVAPARGGNSPVPSSSPSRQR